jgi:hypothetical protein
MDYVRDALRGLRLIFHSKPVHQVPLAQMVETISVPKPSQALLGAHSTRCFCPPYRVASTALNTVMLFLVVFCFALLQLQQVGKQPDVISKYEDLLRCRAG